MDQHVLSNLAYITIMFVSFDLWMCLCGIDIIVLVINFLSDIWVAMHLIGGLFEVNETIRQSMVVQLQSLLERFGLLHQVIAFVNNEGINLTTMAIVLHSIIDCEHMPWDKNTLRWTKKAHADSLIIHFCIIF